LAALSLITLWLLSPPDPRFQGKRLSDHLYATAPSRVIAGPGMSQAAIQQFLAEQAQARQKGEEAIRALGPQTVPLLTAWLRSDWSLRTQLRKLASPPGSQLRWLLNFRWVANDPRTIAAEAVSRLVPEQGGPVIRMLRKEVLANRVPSSGEAAEIITRILGAMPQGLNQRIARENADFIDLVTGPSARKPSDAIVQVLSALLQYDPPEDREAMVRRLWPLRNPGFNSVQRIISRLDRDGFIQNRLCLESGTAAERPDAALYFRLNPQAPRQVVPLLMSNLVETGSISLLQDVCAALAAYGTNAAPALPLLGKLAANPSPVSKGASNAIARITALQEGEKITE